MREAATIDTGRQSAGTGILTSFSAAASRLYRFWRTRRRIVKMTDLDDHMLDDIGVSRNDLYFVLDQPFSQDPAAALRQIAQENRTRRRHA